MENQEKTPLDTLSQLAETVTQRVERVAQQGRAALEDTTDAFVKAYEAQLKTTLALVKKSTDTAKSLVKGDIAGKTGELLDTAVESARESADHWLRFAEAQLGTVRKVVEAAVESGKAA